MSLAPLVYSLCHLYLHNHLSWTPYEADLLAGVAGIPLYSFTCSPVNLQSFSRVWASIAGIGIRLEEVGWIEVLLDFKIQFPSQEV